MARMVAKKLNDMKETMLSFLFTHYLEYEKELCFRNRRIARDTGESSWTLGMVCGELEKDGFLLRYGSNSITWRTRFNEL